MGWVFFDEVEDDSLTAGEWEQIYLLANKGLPHTEVEVDPLHCPTCRLAHAIIIVSRDTPLAEAVVAVSSMPAIALLDAFDYDGS